jgi:hypothetical protein
MMKKLNLNHSSAQRWKVDYIIQCRGGARKFWLPFISHYDVPPPVTHHYEDDSDGDDRYEPKTRQTTCFGLLVCFYSHYCSIATTTKPAQPSHITMKPAQPSHVTTKPAQCSHTTQGIRKKAQNTSFDVFWAVGMFFLGFIPLIYY